MIVAEDLSTAEMADILMLRPYGKWVSSNRPEGELKRPGWTKEILYGRREDPREIIEDIESEDYALMLDGVLATIPMNLRKVILAYYVFDHSQQSISKFRDVSRTSVKHELGNAVHYLYGAVRQKAVFLSSKSLTVGVM